MARTDIARMLTGVGGPAPVQAMPGTAGFAGQFGAQTTAGTGQAIGALTRGGAPSYEETVAQAMGQLDLETPEGLSQLAKYQLASGDTVGAAKTAAGIQKLKADAEDAGLGNLNPQQYTPKSLQAYQDHYKATGEKRLDLLKLIDTTEAVFKEETMRNIVGSIQKRSEAFSNSLALRTKTSTMRKLLDSMGGTGTGKFAGALKSARGYLQALMPGREIEGLAEQEVFEALSNQLALLVRNPKSDMGLPGSTSNKDLEFLIDSVPNLLKSPEGNKLLLDVYDSAHKLKADILDEQRRLIAENGGKPPLNLEQQLSKFADEAFNTKENKELVGKLRGFTETKQKPLPQDLRDNLIRDGFLNVDPEEEEKEDTRTPSQRLADQSKRVFGG